MIAFCIYEFVVSFVIYKKNNVLVYGFRALLTKKSLNLEETVEKRIGHIVTSEIDTSKSFIEKIFLCEKVNQN